jgi:uracil-DNA glycosylase
MLIGEAPRKQENKRGIPFIDKSENLLTHVLEAITINRSDIFIANIVKCITPKNIVILSIEIKTSKDPFLIKHIAITKPYIICILGAALLQEIHKRPVRITLERGLPIIVYTTTIIPTLYLAYILRNPTKLHAFINDLPLVKKIAK